MVLDLLGGTPEPSTGRLPASWRPSILPAAPDRVVVMGCSAGSMGAQLASPLLYQWAKASGVESVALVADSFLGAFEQTATLRGAVTTFGGCGLFPLGASGSTPVEDELAGGSAWAFGAIRDALVQA